MAQQHTVRALVPYERSDELREQLLRLEGVDPDSVTISAPDPATYRDETADNRLRELIRYGWPRLLIGAVVGAVVGALLALLIPWEWAIYTIPLFAFGGAWGGAVTSAARSIQVAKEDEPNDLPDETVEVGPEQTQDLRVLTIVTLRDRPAVVDLLADQDDVRLLDSWHPKVGQGPDARPDESPPAT
jgi:hypothetical protein